MKYRILISILIMLLARKTVTAAQIAERFEISKRTVYRYIDELSFACIPVMTERGPNGGFKIADTYKLPNMYFTESEFATLTSLFTSLKEQLGDSEITTLLEKLTAAKKNENVKIVSSSLVIDGTGWTADKSFSAKLSVVAKAVENSELLKIGYRAASGEQTVREIEPHALALKNGIWYVYAYCRLREDFRLFKISRIEYAAESGKFEKRPFDFKAKPIAEWTDCDEYIEFTLEVSPEAKADVEEWLGVDNVYTSNGKIIAEARLPHNKTLISEILKFGSGVKILSPKELKADVIDCAKSIIGLYD